MHSAPAVRYPVARSGGAAVGLLTLWLLAGGSCLWWWLHGGAAILQFSLAVALLVLGGALAFAQWCALPSGWLRWDGQTWWWQSAAGEDEHAVSLSLHVDLQHAMLVRAKGASRLAPWCFLERSLAPARWPDLRRALIFSSSLAAARGLPAVPRL